MAFVYRDFATEAVALIDAPSVPLDTIEGDGQVWRLGARFPAAIDVPEGEAGPEGSRWWLLEAQPSQVRHIVAADLPWQLRGRVPAGRYRCWALSAALEVEGTAPVETAPTLDDVDFDGPAIVGLPIGLVYTAGGVPEPIVGADWFIDDVLAGIDLTFVPEAQGDLTARVWADNAVDRAEVTIGPAEIFERPGLVGGGWANGDLGEGVFTPPTATGNPEPTIDLTFYVDEVETEATEDEGTWILEGDDQAILRVDVRAVNTIAGTEYETVQTYEFKLIVAPNPVSWSDGFEGDVLYEELTEEDLTPPAPGTDDWSLAPDGATTLSVELLALPEMIAFPVKEVEIAADGEEDAPIEVTDDAAIDAFVVDVGASGTRDYRLRWRTRPEDPWSPWSAPQSGSTAGGDELAATVSTDAIVVEEITINLAAARPVGRFISGNVGIGDPFVVGPCVVTGWTPAPGLSGTRTINGAMLNPLPSTNTLGFDSRNSSVYDAAKNAAFSLPITMNPGDTLVVAKSNLSTGSGAPASDGSNAVRQFAVLTCVAEVPFADSFRPQVVPNLDGTPAPIWRWSDVDTGKLASATPEAGFPTWASAEAAWDRFHLDIVTGWRKAGNNAVLHKPVYGRDLAAVEARSFVMVNCSGATVEQKKKTLIGMIQRGIDIYGVAKRRADSGGSAFMPDGGWNFGRKFPIMFAGRLLGDDDMLNIDLRVPGKSAPENPWTLFGPTYNNARRRFAEDGHCYYVEQAMIDGTNGSGWNPDFALTTTRPQGPWPQGAYNQPGYTGGAESKTVETLSAGFGYHKYQMIFGQSVGAYALACLMMGLRENWRYEPFFDYVAMHTRLVQPLSDPWQRQNGATEDLYPDHPGYDLDWRDSGSGGPRPWAGQFTSNAGAWVASMLVNRYFDYLTREPVNWVPPEVIASNVYTVGQTVTIRRGCWSGWPLPTYALTWQQNISGTWTDISGANGESYTIVSGNAGRTLRLKVVASNSEGTSAPVYSDATPAVT